MNTAIFIGRRLSLKSESGRATSPGVVTGIIGVALAIVVMLIAVSVVNGFKKEIVDKLSGYNADITVYSPENAESAQVTSGIRLTDSVRTIVGAVAPSARVELIITQPAIFKTDNDFQGLILKGLQPGEPWEFYASNLVSGSVPDSIGADPNQVLISSVTADMLSLHPGDRITTHFLDNNSVRTRRLTVTGIFDTHFHDYDKMMAFTPIAMLQKLNRLDSVTGSAIEIRGIAMPEIDPAADRINQGMLSATVENPSNPMIFNVETIGSTCAQYLNWLDLLDTNVLVIIILMSCVSAFTLISGLFIIILERVNTIGILKAIGATNAQIRRIFIYMAERLVIKGMVIGNALALAVILLQRHYHFMHLNPEAYYLNFVPMELDWKPFVIINASVVILSALILILPSHIIARLSPATSLRFE